MAERESRFELTKLLVQPGASFNLQKDCSPRYTGRIKKKDEAEEILLENVQQLAELQDRLWADNRYAVLVIFQALDAAGKDGTIKHVFSGVNPQGCRVTSFKVPSEEELDHDYLWRAHKALPERGTIGVFNRSYYEEVLVVRVHPEFLLKQRLPPSGRTRQIWQYRFEDINAFERYLARNGVMVVKFFLNVSKDEQRQRFLKRIERPEKNWKFSARDVEERRFWREYQRAYEDCLRHTSTPWAPWYVIPADYKWFARLAVSEIMVRTLRKLDLKYPQLSEVQRQALLAMKARLAAGA